MANTPRTDAIKFPSEVLLPASEKHLGYSVRETVRILGDHARQLERELSEQAEAMFALKWIIRRDYMPSRIGRGMLATAMSVLNDPDCPTIIRKILEKQK